MNARLWFQPQYGAGEAATEESKERLKEGSNGRIEDRHSKGRWAEIDGAREDGPG